MDGSGSSDLSFLYEMLNLGFDGYTSEISQVVDRTFSNSPRTAVSVREILTPRTPGLAFGEEIPATPKTPRFSDVAHHKEHPPTPITPRRFGSQPVSAIYHPTAQPMNDTSRSLNSSSSWPALSSLEQEHLHRQLQNHLRQQQQQGRFSDFAMSPVTPRSGSTDLPPYNSSRAASNTPRTPRPLASIKEQAGSNLSLDQLRNFKLYERSLPHPSHGTPQSARKENVAGVFNASGSFRDAEVSFGPNPFPPQGGFGPGLAVDNVGSLTASGPGVSRENGVHVPYLNLPLTSRSNTLKTGELLSALLSGYQTSSTNASSTLYNPQGTGTVDNQVNMTQHVQGIQGDMADSGDKNTSAGWTRRDKMLLIGLVCIVLVVVLLAIIVLLIAVGVVKDDGDDSRSSSEMTSSDGGVQRETNVDDIGAIMDNQANIPFNTTISPTSGPTLFTPATNGASTAAITATTTATSQTLTSTTASSKRGKVLPTTHTTTTTTKTIPTQQRSTSKIVPTAADTTTISPTTNSPLVTTPSTTSSLSSSVGTPATTTSTTTETTKRPTTSQTTPTPTSTIVPTTSSTTTIITPTSTTITTTTITTTSTTTTTTTATTTTTTETPTTTITTQNPLKSLVYSSCDTPKCQTFSNTLKASMNASASPCESFYGYACGSRSVSPRQPHQLLATGTALQEMVSEDLYKRAVEPLTQLDPNSSSDDERLGATLYQACFASNTAENEDEVFRETASLLQSLDLSSDLSLPLSLDLLLRRAQDKFGVSPFVSVTRLPQFDGTAYRYSTRITLPRLTFPDEEYYKPFESSKAASAYIDTLSYIIKQTLVSEAATSRGRKKRTVMTSEYLQSNRSSTQSFQSRRKRQANEVTEETIKETVRNVFLLEWNMAQQLMQAERDQDRSHVISHVTLRSLQNQVPQLPWVLLTDLSLIDTVQVSGLGYMTALNTLLFETSPALVKMLVYVQCVVSLLPFMPATVRTMVQDTNTGIERIYSAESCARLTLTVAFQETMASLLETGSLDSNVDPQLALQIADRAKTELLDTYSAYSAMNEPTKQALLNDLSTLSYKPASLQPVSGGQHSIQALGSLPASSTSLVSVAPSIMAHKRAEMAAQALGSETRAEVMPSWGLEFVPLVNAEEGSAVLPIGFIYLASWAQEAEFLEEFLKSFVHRSLVDFVIRKHLFSDSYLAINSCPLRGFRNVYTDEPESADSVREMQVSALTEAAVQGMLFRNVDRSNIVAIQLGTDYFYERDLIYVAYAQTWCQKSDSSTGFVQPKLLLDQTIRRDYRSSNWFYRCQRPSCFFWAQGDFGSEGEGTR